MRPLAGLAIVFVLGVGAAEAARAAEASADGSAALLMSAAFSGEARAVEPDPIGALLDRQTARKGVGATGWTSNQVVLGRSHGRGVNNLRVSVGGALKGLDGRSLALAPVAVDQTDLDAQSYEIALTRDWPGAVSVSNGRYALDVTPHAGVGMTSLGGSAEAGATVTLGQSGEDRVRSGLSAMGVRDGADFGDTGRWFIYAAASGRAVGLNMLKDQATGWDRAWSQDSASTLISDAQLGVAWRKGAMQTSLGYVHREVKGEHMLMGQEAKDDSLVAFSLSIKPRN